MTLTSFLPWIFSASDTPEAKAGRLIRTVCTQGMPQPVSSPLPVMIAEQLGGKGNVLMMHGHPGQTAEVKRTEGAMDILAQNPDMTLLDEQTADWDRAEAMTLMENWIQAYGDQINAVFCQNDEMALGALNALVQAGKKDNVLVVGVDAIDDALQSVKDGKMDATVYQDCKGQAEGAIEAAYKLAKGESVEKEILIPFILVTTENVDEYLK